jgi:putative Mn2+ efflux pump MntP
MGFVEALLLSLALCVDTLVVSATTAFRSHLSWRRGILMAIVFGFCQGAFPLAGALIGDVARSFIEAVDHWVAFALLAIVGGNMIVEQLRNHTEDERVGEGTSSAKQSLGKELRTYFLLGTATSIDALAVGIGLGLGNPMSTVLWVVLLIGAVTAIVSLVGTALGKRSVPVPERTASIIAGVVLIGLGVKILLEHLLG